MQLRSTAFLAISVCGLMAAGGVMPERARAQAGADAELEMALDAALRRIEKLEAQLGTGSGSHPGMAQALASANEEAGQYRELYKDLLLRVEALGLDTVRSDKALQDRLIKAVRERQMLQDRNDEAMEQLMRLSEAIMEYLKASGPEARLRIESELRATDQLLGFGAERHLREEVKLNEGQVISFKDELDLAVLNVGRESGARVGMPLNIYRKDRLVGTALIVDVRDSISGAIVQELYTGGDHIQVRDRIEARTATPKNL